MVKSHVCLCVALLGSLRGIAWAAEEPTIIAEGKWSKAVADDRGYALRGRLVLAVKPRSDERREVVVYVELQDACDFVGGSMLLYCDLGKTDFRPEYKGGLQCEMHDQEKRPVKAMGYPFGGAVPLSRWVSLPTDSTIRLRTTPFGIHRPGALAISPELSKMWVIDEKDRSEYFLSGKFTIDPAKDRLPPTEEHVWRGVLELPAVRIVASPPKAAVKE